MVALGESAIDPLNTFKLGFGYTTEKWYQRPAFETLEDGNGLFPAVTDPNAFFSPTFGNNLPGFVGLLPRPADFPYDARRVNDVDAAGEAFFFPTPAHGQNFLFRQAGDSDGVDRRWWCARSRPEPSDGSDPRRLPDHLDAAALAGGSVL